MPEQLSQQPSQISNPQNVEVIQPVSNPAPQVSNNQTKKSRSGVVTFVLILVGAFVGFLLGGTVYEYVRETNFLSGSGLAGANVIILFPIPVFATLSVFAYDGIRSANKRKKLFGYIFLIIIAFSLASSIFLLYLSNKARLAEIAKIPSKVDFQIYKPSQAQPFKNLKEGGYDFNEEAEMRCRGVRYVYHGTENGLSLSEMKVNEYNCPEFNFTNQEKYDEALKAAKENSTLYLSSTVTSKEVDGETILMIFGHRSGNTWFDGIYGMKGGTLIYINAACISGANCEDKYLEFYKSLEPISLKK